MAALELHDEDQSELKGARFGRKESGAGFTQIQGFYADRLSKTSYRRMHRPGSKTGRKSSSLRGPGETENPQSYRRNLRRFKPDALFSLASKLCGKARYLNKTARARRTRRWSGV